MIGGIGSFSLCESDEWWTSETKDPFIATQLNSTRRRVELS